MTRQAADVYGTAFKGGTLTLLARVVDASGGPVTAGGIAAAAYSVFLLDDQDPNARTTVAGHDQVTLAPAGVISDALRLDAPWDATADGIGYNFRHTLDVAQHPAFAIAGRRYLVEYRFTPSGGQPILLRFRINVI